MFPCRLGSSHAVLRPVSSLPVLKKRGCGCKLGAELPALAALLLRRPASASYIWILNPKLSKFMPLAHH